MTQRISTLLIALMAFFAIGCGSSFNPSGFFPDDPTPPPPPPPPGVDSGFLRVANLSPDAGAVDFYLDGVQYRSNVAFERFTNYSEVESGSVEISVFPAGEQEGAIFTGTVELTTDAHQTFALIGTEASAEGRLLADRISDGDESLARLFHTVPGAPAVELTDQDGNRLLGPVTYGQATAYTDIDSDVEPTALQLRTTEGEVLATYSQIRGGDTPLLEAIDGASRGVNVTLAAAGDGLESLPLIAVLDQANLGGFTFVADPDAEPEPVLPIVNVRVMHASVDESETAVDVYLDDAEEPFVSGLAYQAASDYQALEVEEGATSTFRVRAAGSDEDLFTLERTFGEADYDGRFTLTIFPEDDDDVEYGLGQVVPQRLVLGRDRVEPTAGALGALFVHASPTFGPVRLEISQGQDSYLPLSGDLTFGEVLETTEAIESELQASSDQVIYVRDVSSGFVVASFVYVGNQTEVTFIETLLDILSDRDQGVNFNIYFTGSHTAGISLVAAENDPDAGSETVLSNGSFAQ